MIRRPPRLTRTDTLFPYTTLFRSYFGRVVGAPVYTVHTSSGEALAAAVEQRRQGSRITIETCTHYLTHDTTAAAGAVAKVNPPLRAPADREALWEGIRRGDIDTVPTDHIHRPVSSQTGGIWKAHPGFRPEAGRVGKECVSTMRSR